MLTRNDHFSYTHTFTFLYHTVRCWPLGNVSAVREGWTGSGKVVRGVPHQPDAHPVSCRCRKGGQTPTAQQQLMVLDKQHQQRTQLPKPEGHTTCLLAAQLPCPHALHAAAVPAAHSNHQPNTLRPVLGGQPLLPPWPYLAAATARHAAAPLLLPAIGQMPTCIRAYRPASM